MGVLSGDPERARNVAAEVVRRLDALYGRRPWGASHRPLDELVLTILSQHTSDINSDRAFDELRRRFPTWEDIRRAPVGDIADAIRSGGLADQKAPRIQAVLNAVLDGDKSPPLSWLDDLPLAEAKAHLTALPGVGPKTAACVLLFACGRPALPVDTHIYRVTKRIGLIAGNVTEAKAHEALERILDPADVYTFHLNVVTHGRRICVARAPRCHRCPLTDLCAYYRQHRLAEKNNGA